MRATAEHIDAFKELINIGVGRAANSISKMCGAPVRLQVPEVQIVGADYLKKLLTGSGDEGKLAAVRMPFSGSFQGVAELVFPTQSAAKLVSLLTGEGEPLELDAMRASTLTEIGNIVLNGVLGSMTNVLGEHVSYEVPVYVEATARKLVAAVAEADAALLLAQTHFYIGISEFVIEGQEVAGEVNLLFGVDSFDALTRRIDAMIGMPAC